jgi:Rieske Fe-S protein
MAETPQGESLPRGDDAPQHAKTAGSGNVDTERRSLITTGSSLLMASGLVGGYGTFFVMAGRYLFPTGDDKAWMFVRDAAGFQPGESMAFVAPTGVKVNITRRRDGASDDAPTVDDFLALSSVCPHLGCRVQWEPHNDRFFCPCHNGVFDPDGQPVSGPPAADGQELPRYALQIVDGALYIEMPTTSVADRRR